MEREQMLATLRLVRGHYEMAVHRLGYVEKLLGMPERAVSVLREIRNSIDTDGGIDDDAGHRMWVNLCDVEDALCPTK